MGLAGGCRTIHGAAQETATMGKGVYLSKCPCSCGDRGGSNSTASANVHDAHATRKPSREVNVVHGNGGGCVGCGWQAQCVCKVWTPAAGTLCISSWTIVCGLHTSTRIYNRPTCHRRCHVETSTSNSHSDPEPVWQASLSDQSPSTQAMRSELAFCTSAYLSAGARQFDANQKNTLFLAAATARDYTSLETCGSRVQQSLCKKTTRLWQMSDRHQPEAHLAALRRSSVRESRPVELGEG